MEALPGMDLDITGLLCRLRAERKALTNTSYGWFSLERRLMGYRLLAREICELEEFYETRQGTHSTEADPTSGVSSADSLHLRSRSGTRASKWPSTTVETHGRGKERQKRLPHGMPSSINAWPSNGTEGEDPPYPTEARRPISAVPAELYMGTDDEGATGICVSPNALRRKRRNRARRERRKRMRGISAGEWALWNPPRTGATTRAWDKPSPRDVDRQIERIKDKSSTPLLSSTEDNGPRTPPLQPTGAESGASTLITGDPPATDGEDRAMSACMAHIHDTLKCQTEALVELVRDMRVSLRPAQAQVPQLAPQQYQPHQRMAPFLHYGATANPHVVPYYEPVMDMPWGQPGILMGSSGQRAQWQAPTGAYPPMTMGCGTVTTTDLPADQEGGWQPAMVGTTGEPLVQSLTVPDA